MKKVSQKPVLLSTLKVGEKFRLNTTRYFLKLHIYKVIEVTGNVVKYVLDGNDKHNQTTTVNGKSISVIKLK